MKAALIDSFALKSYEAKEERDHCPICFEPLPATVTLCGHWFCGDCLLPALENVPACPLCKSPTDYRKDVVSIGKPVVSAEQSAFIDFLAETLKKGPAKSVVVCSYGELHEKLVCVLQAKGVNIVAWKGNARQVNQHCEAYCQEGVKCCLLLDPASLSPSWLGLCLPPTEQIYILAPLSAAKKPQCCQIRAVVDIFKDAEGKAPACCIVCRDENHIPLCPGGHCRHQRNGCLTLVRTP